MKRELALRFSRADIVAPAIWANLMTGGLKSELWAVSPAVVEERLHRLRTLDLQDHKDLLILPSLLHCGHVKGERCGQGCWVADLTEDC